MTRVANRKIATEKILQEVWAEVLRLDWLPNVLSKAARTLDVAPSTLTRRFKSNGRSTLERQLIDWALKPDGQPDRNFAQRLASQMIEQIADEPDVAGAIDRCARVNWRAVSTDDRMSMQMFLWSRIGENRALRDQMHSHYRSYDQVHRVLWHDILNHLRKRTGKQIQQRQGLNDEEIIIVLDALVEGFMLRWKADQTLPIGDLYAAAFQAIVSAALDFNGDGRSVAEHLERQVAGV